MNKENTSGFSLSFNAFGDILGNSLQILLPVAWRVLVVYLVASLSAGLLVFIGVLLYGLNSSVGLFNDGFEVDMFSNISSIVFSVLAFVLYIVYISLAWIAMILIIKNHINKKENNPLKVLFVDSWQYFGRYLWLIIRVGWYVMWPSLTVVLFPLSIYRAVKSYFPFFVFFHFNKSVKESLKISIKIAKGNWWGIVGFYFLLFCIFMGAYMAIFMIGYFVVVLPTMLLSSMIDFSSILNNEIIVVIGFALLGIAYFAVIFAFSALFMSFSYFFTLYMVKAKNIKI